MYNCAVNLFNEGAFAVLFNSYEFIFYFLPSVFVIYFVLQYAGLSRLAKLSLVGASLFFYSWWNVSYLPLILTSVVVNYAVGTFRTLKMMPIVRTVLRVLTLSVLVRKVPTA